MHPDLSRHLHTDECNKLIDSLIQCHSDNKFLKFLGACNSIDHHMLICLKRERLRRRARNAEEGLKKRAEIKARVLADTS